jgi:chromosome segregation ATPase
LQEKLLSSKADMVSFDTQLGELKTRNEKLTADLNESGDSKERVAALEGELATKDQALSGSENRLSQLAKELDQEKESKGRLSSELSTKEALIVELQDKLANAQSNALEVETKIKSSSIAINELQEQLLSSKAEKVSFETQLAQLKSRNVKFTADLNELRDAKERVAELEAVAAGREQTLSQTQQKLLDLAEELDREKTSTETLNSELLMKADLVAELQQKLETTLSGRAKLVDDSTKSRKEISELQNQLRELKAQPAATGPSAVIVDVKPKSTSPSEASGEQDQSPSPFDIIDRVLKKKAKQ